jgi:formylmethanofuran dehydrogenase subunit B
LGVVLLDVLPSAADAMSVAVQFGVPLTLSQSKHVYSEHVTELVKQLEQSKASVLRSRSL